MRQGTEQQKAKADDRLLRIALGNADVKDELAEQLDSTTSTIEHGTVEASAVASS